MLFQINDNYCTCKVFLPRTFATNASELDQSQDTFAAIFESW